MDKRTVTQEEIFDLIEWVLNEVERAGLDSVRAWIIYQRGAYREGGESKKAGRNNRLFHAYLAKIFGGLDDNFRLTPTTDKAQAIADLQGEFGFSTWEACYRALQREIARRRKSGAHIPQILPQSQRQK